MKPPTDKAIKLVAAIVKRTAALKAPLETVPTTFEASDECFPEFRSFTSFVVLVRSGRSCYGPLGGPTSSLRSTTVPSVVRGAEMSKM